MYHLIETPNRYGLYLLADNLIFMPTSMSQTQCINYTIMGDNLIEETQQVIIEFTAQNERDAANSDLSATITIYDDDSEFVCIVICIARATQIELSD